jgi:hypothetical protein
MPSVTQPVPAAACGQVKATINRIYAYHGNGETQNAVTLLGKLSFPPLSPPGEKLPYAIADGMKYVISGSQQDGVQFQHNLQALKKAACPK